LSQKIAWKQRESPVMQNLDLSQSMLHFGVKQWFREGSGPAESQSPMGDGAEVEPENQKKLWRVSLGRLSFFGGERRPHSTRAIGGHQRSLSFD
jgi:hypothetical protein